MNFDCFCPIICFSRVFPLILVIEDRLNCACISLCLPLSLRLHPSQILSPLSLFLSLSLSVDLVSVKTLWKIRGLGCVIRGHESRILRHKFSALPAFVPAARTTREG